MGLRMLVGTETEFAVTALDGDDRVLSLDGVLRRMCERASARPHLMSTESGIVLGNGGRFYQDVGNHPEYASPETSNPYDSVVYALAGDRLMSQLAREVADDDPTIASLLVRKGNVDYATSNSWANHENYLHRCSPAQLRPALVAHLVSRVVLTGAGGLDPFSARPRFVLSPRALFMRRLVASSAPGQIALVDERAQPHCTGFHRQHVMCGDANLSHLAMFLRIGTTALVVALIEADCAADEDVRLANPLAALATVARDVTLRRRLQLASGRLVTAIAIQRHYLRQARRCRQRLPEWTSAVCEVWQDALDRLALGPEAVADRLDWAIKLAVFRDRAVKRGKQWPAIDDSPVERVSPSGLNDPDTWRAELCEIDLRFGQVYPTSLFDALDQAGVLRHRVASVDAIEEAVSTPPADGRARIRGNVVRRLAAHAIGVQCGWDGIQDSVSRRTLDLSSPFADTEVWRDLPPDQPAAHVLVAQLAHLAGSPPSAVVTRSIRQVAERLSASGDQAPARRGGEHAIRLNNFAFEMRGAGRLEDAKWLMRAALAIDIAVRPENHPKVPHRRNNLGTVLLMQGRAAEARAQVTLAWQQTGGRYDLTSARVLTMRLIIAMILDEPSELFMGQLKNHLAMRPLPNFADVDRHWQMVPVLNVLAPSLGGEALRLLQAIVGVVNSNLCSEALEEIPLWCDTLAEPLGTAWPV